MDDRIESEAVAYLGDRKATRKRSPDHEIASACLEDLERLARTHHRSIPPGAEAEALGAQVRLSALVRMERPAPTLTRRGVALRPRERQRGTPGHNLRRRLESQSHLKSIRAGPARVGGRGVVADPHLPEEGDPRQRRVLGLEIGGGGERQLDIPGQERTSGCATEAYSAWPKRNGAHDRTGRARNGPNS